MKKNLITVIAIVCCISIYSQEGVEVPLTTPMFRIESGTYVKDINNVLDPYTGTWEALWEDKKFTLKIEKIIKKPHTYESGFYYYEDELVGRYAVIDLSNGNVIENNFDSQLENVAISSLSLPKDNQFSLFYSVKDECGYNADLILIGNPLSNQLLYKFFYDDIKVGSNCRDVNPDEIPIYIPTVDVTLNRL